MVERGKIKQNLGRVVGLSPQGRVWKWKRFLLSIVPIIMSLLVLVKGCSFLGNYKLTKLFSNIHANVKQMILRTML